MSKLIVIDPGHGGYDYGATYGGRSEKDDNLRLGLAVTRILRNAGQRVVMTRDGDHFVSLDERAKMANNAAADLFVSLHRNSYERLTPDSNGVENWIYTTAPARDELYARTVLDEVVQAGVQSNRGVKRGNYAVLRQSDMPSMLLEMGYIINDTDNRLFDENLNRYAEAIARGIVKALGEPDIAGGSASGSASGSGTSAAASGDAAVRQLQRLLNDGYGAGLAVDGVRGPETKRALLRALQTALNRSHGAGLTVDGVWGAATQAAIPNLAAGSRGEPVRLLQAALAADGYSPGAVDGVYGSGTADAVTRFQRSRGLDADGIAGRRTFAALFG